MEDRYIPPSWHARFCRLLVMSSPRSHFCCTGTGFPSSSAGVSQKQHSEVCRGCTGSTEENTCVWFLNANSGILLQFGPNSKKRDFLMLQLKLFGAISNRAINQWSFLSCPEGKENRDLNAKFSFQLHQDVVSGLDVFRVSVLEEFKFISQKSVLTQKFNEFRGNNWSLNSC